jgi:hypothetical protein
MWKCTGIGEARRRVKRYWRRIDTLIVAHYKMA